MPSIQQSDPRRAISVIIPLYRNADLVAPLLNSLSDCRVELAELQCTVILINDSPDDAALASELAQAVHSFPVEVPCKIVANQANLGFLKSANSACQDAVASGTDVILLNSDTLLFPGAFREMQRVAYLDSMIGFVSPRSNNATICTFPHQTDYCELGPEQFHQIFLELSAYLPAFHYVPICVGFCLFIKRAILAEIGLFDEVYGKGYSEENDLILRANRFGYRAVLANRAFVYHIGERSFSASDMPKALHERRNFALLTKRFPEYLEQLDAYFGGAHREAERLLAGLLPDADGRIDVAFDCSHVHKRHNGTFRALAKLIHEASASWGDKFNIYVIADADVARFHGFTSNPRVLLEPVDTNRVFGIAYRLGQPFQPEEFLRMSRLAPVNIYAMLDTIAWDCLYLNRAELDDLWGGTARYADGILYISDFSRDQFRLRFPVRPDMPEQVSYLSLVPEEYLHEPAIMPAAEVQGETYLLLIGNSFAHKYIEPTVRAISRELPRVKLVALGLETSGRQNLTAYGSGHLDSGMVGSLFAGARAVIFPSTYEGFGMPVLEALSRRKVLYVRDTPLNRAIHARLGLTRNLILYESTDCLIKMLAADRIPEWTDDVTPTGGVHTWASHAQGTKQLLEQALSSFSYEKTLMPRLAFAGLLEKAGNHEAQRRSIEDDSRSRRLPIRQCDLDAALSPTDVVPILEDLRIGIDRLGDEAWTDLKLEIANLRAVIQDREENLAAVRSSLSWIVTAPLRLLLDVWLRVFGRKNG